MHKGEQKLYDVIVIGGGASGLMAAGVAAARGKHVLVVEKNTELGKKLAITGGERCNITNAQFDTHLFLEKFPESKKFLYSPFSKFSSKDTFDFFQNECSLPLVVQARLRAFPASEKASDVRDALVKYCKDHGVELALKSPVTKITTAGDKIISVESGTGKKKKTFTAKKFILSTGGLAAPETGSTGDGFTFLEQLGHTVKNPNPNIVPLTTDATWIHRLAGVSFSFMKIYFKVNGKSKISLTGKILLTHFGISGPLILNAAHDVKKLLDKKEEVIAHIDLFPDTTIPDLDRRIWRLFEKNKNKMVKNVLPELLPKQFVEELLQFNASQNPHNMSSSRLGELAESQESDHLGGMRGSSPSEVDPRMPARSTTALQARREDDTQKVNAPTLQIGNKKIHEVSREERKLLTKTLKDLRFPITGTLGYEKAVIADGGVDPTEVDFTTMASRKYPNLYLIGDTLSINRPSGGYSLQLCWTTAWVAAQDC